MSAGHPSAPSASDSSTPTVTQLLDSPLKRARAARSSDEAPPTTPTYGEMMIEQALNAERDDYQAASDEAPDTIDGISCAGSSCCPRFVRLPGRTGPHDRDGTLRAIVLPLLLMERARLKFNINSNSHDMGLHMEHHAGLQMTPEWSCT